MSDESDEEARAKAQREMEAYTITGGFSEKPETIIGLWWSYMSPHTRGAIIALGLLSTCICCVGLFYLFA